MLLVLSGRETIGSHGTITYLISYPILLVPPDAITAMTESQPTLRPPTEMMITTTMRKQYAVKFIENYGEFDEAAPLEHGV